MRAKRQIVRIDEEKCDGCGQCATACVEEAIVIVGGKAKVVSESFCDGLGECLGSCPREAIIIEEREAEAFDAEATRRHMDETRRKASATTGGCPGTLARSLGRARGTESPGQGGDGGSNLTHWPVQLALVPPTAEFLKGADLLVSADCVPFALGDFHSRYLAGRAVLVGCPKLDDIEFYRDKLERIFAEARPRSVTVLRMEVPCCGALARAALEAWEKAGGQARLAVHTVGVEGDVVREETQARA